jgi:hypothetical protein
MCKFLLLLIAVGFVAMGFLVQGATTWSAEPTAATDLPTDGRILFRVQVSKRLMQTSALAEGKSSTDFSQVILPGRLYAPPIKLAPVAQASAKWNTPAAAASADFSAQKADDAGWIVENFASSDRSEVQSFLSDKDIRSRNRALFRAMNARYISGQVNYKDYVLLFVRDGNPRRSPKVLTLEKGPDGYKRTNALSKDDTFDIVWCALRDGEVRVVD